MGAAGASTSIPGTGCTVRRYRTYTIGGARRSKASSPVGPTTRDRGRCSELDGLDCTACQIPNHVDWLHLLFRPHAHHLHLLPPPPPPSPVIPTDPCPPLGNRWIIFPRKSARPGPFLPSPFPLPRSRAPSTRPFRAHPTTSPATDSPSTPTDGWKMYSTAQHSTA
jgi:hypothetical protein